ATRVARGWCGCGDLGHAHREEFGRGGVAACTRGGLHERVQLCLLLPWRRRLFLPSMFFSAFCHSMSPLRSCTPSHALSRSPLRTGVVGLERPSRQDPSAALRYHSPRFGSTGTWHLCASMPWRAWSTGAYPSLSGKRASLNLSESLN